MNQQLIAIQELILQNTLLNEQEKQELFQLIKKAEKEFAITEFKLDRTEKVKRTTAILLEETIEELEQKRKAVEAQNREMEIEAALERVRSKALAMHHSDELLNVISEAAVQFQFLGFNVDSANFNVDYRKKDWDLWLYSFAMNHPVQLSVPWFDHPVCHEKEKALDEGNGFYTGILSKQEKDSFLNHLFNNTILKHSPEERKQNLLEKKAFAWSTVFSTNTSVTIANYEGVPYSEKENAIVRRFANVFEQSYTRFLDLQKAEAQAIEAKIEASLERVRSRAMAMHSADELADTSKLLFEQLLKFGLKPRTCGFLIMHEESEYMDDWSSHVDESDEIKLVIGKIGFYQHPLITKVVQSWQKKEPYFIEEMHGEELKNYFKAVTSKETSQYDIGDEVLTNITSEYTNSFYFEYGMMYVLTPKSLTQNEVDIIMRFASVFKLTYRRYLDINKAEAQAREAKIEVALERVRARAMAMHKSEDLNNVVVTLFEQLRLLDLNVSRCGIGILNKETRTGYAWATVLTDKDEPVQVSGDESFDVHPLLKGVFDAWLQKEKEFSYVLENEDLIKYYKALESTTPMPLLSGISKQYYNAALFNAGGLFGFQEYPFSDEAKSIMRRFANVLNLTYKRFLDLQKAEGQAREAKIEVALERVRSRAMAMQKSDELKDLIATVSSELSKLDFVFDRCFFMIFDPKTKDSIWWMSHPESPEPSAMHIKYHEHTPYLAHIKAWQKRQIKWEYVLEGDVKKTWDKFLFNETELSKLPQQVKANMRGLEKVFFSSSFNNFGCLSLATHEPLPNELFEIMLRFAKVFDLTYTRFNDLKQAEAQAREANIEASLERVRSKAMSMHSSEELTETIRAFYQQISYLNGIPQRCGVSLFDKETHKSEFTSMYTTEEGKPVEIIAQLKLTGHPILEAMYEHWLLQKEYHPVLRGNEIKEYYQFIRPQVSFPDYSHNYVQYGYYFFFPEGTVYAWTEEEMKEDELQIYRRFTSVLSLTYKRYKDLNQAEAYALQAEEDLIKLQNEKKKAIDALTELKATQLQLIQSEKMASLGELTAGIAHEIQNPLNFVNNFSEVNTELIEELKAEAKAGNTEEVLAIANDLNDNLLKIAHHGKRADSIVKGMLQHSRKTNDKKELTDINALADEYIRLSYHGLRAKNKSFNAKIETNFDEGIGKIEVIPQDIGRVLLNLLNNAFYSVAEKKKRLNNTYEPTVTIITLKKNETIIIKVTDNGVGIPKDVVQKIYQPFFTTKPTGEGTGLGLSLSYDIITKGHGGEMKVETTENEGATFTISLPANNH